ncbi:hypothetical protein BKA64DRAFT_760312 [Cadophora sp. MPI-SDFR-AT-0126]|nr:hypothetical protein BKA64DRAFT_760312 [Leotiomycetes sp. MPI-SDFR-AT-0126]
MTKVSPSMRWTLYILGFLGFYGTWIRSALNGTLLILFRSLHVTGTLPGGELPLKSSLTGIYWPVDYLLNMLIVFFWQAVDGSHPSTSLFGLYFAGQHLAIIVTLYVDSYKTKRAQTNESSPSLWLYIFQATAVATTGPWFVLYTLAAGEASNSFTTSKANVKSINFIPLTITIGYILLVVAMAIPSTGPRAIVSLETQQVAVAVWNVFPIFTGLLQWTFDTIFCSPDKSTTTSSKKSSVPDVELRSALRHTYAFAIFVSFAAHIAALTTTFSTVLFPTLSSIAAAQTLKPGTVFRLSLSHTEVHSMGSGALQFMQWDLVIGFLTVLIPAASKYHSSQTLAGNSKNVVTLVLKLLVAVALVGPGAAFVGIKWLDDEVGLTLEGSGAASKRR